MNHDEPGLGAVGQGLVYQFLAVEQGTGLDPKDGPAAGPLKQAFLDLPAGHSHLTQDGMKEGEPIRRAVHDLGARIDNAPYGCRQRGAHDLSEQVRLLRVLVRRSLRHEAPCPIACPRAATSPVQLEAAKRAGWSGLRAVHRRSDGKALRERPSETRFRGAPQAPWLRYPRRAGCLPK